MKSLLLLAFSAIVAAAPIGSRAPGPCDIWAEAKTPCVAAHSVTRALYSGFTGALYQVKRLPDDNTTLDIGVNEAGFARSDLQDAYCIGFGCVIHRIYDQSPRGNHLDTAPAGGNVHRPDAPVNASKEKLTLSGNPVYGAYFEGGMGYRIDKTSGVATGDEPEVLYMVTGGQHYNGGCCFDYGNAETNNNDDGVGTMEAVYWGNSRGWSSGSGNGPWVMADLENGLWAGDNKTNPSYPPVNYTYVTALVKGDSGNHFALKAGDAQEGKLLTMYDGPRPKGYHPMKKQGSIILGIGGDNSNRAVGTFYEGAITQGYTTDAADLAVQQNILSVGYGK